jgi:transcription initiation factor TFIIH subunit 4
VELLKIIFNLTLSEDNKAYKLRSSDPTIVNIIQEDFQHLGLVEFTNHDPTKFYITKYMQSFLLTRLGTNQLQTSAKAASPYLLAELQTSNSAEKFIIVETNFRVFAYTKNKLYKEILKLFLEPRKEFPDMFFGVLTKSKVERAFK